MTEVQQKLLGLAGYVEEIFSLKGATVFTVGEYRQPFFHENEFQGREGVYTNLTDDFGPVWLKVKRIRRHAPPAPSDKIAQWLEIVDDPNSIPVITKHRTVIMNEAEALALIEQEKVSTEDILQVPDAEDDAKQLSVILFLDNFPEVEQAIDQYLIDSWHAWAEAEKPRRETMRIYENLFSLHQIIQVETSKPLELVWGIGIGRWKIDGKRIDHPIVEQLVEMEVDSQTGDVLIRPREVEPRLAISAYASLEIPGVAALSKGAEEIWSLLDDDSALSPFAPDTFEPILKLAAATLDSSGQYYPDQIKDAANRNVPEITDNLIITDTWVLFARERSENVFLLDMQKLKKNIEVAKALPKPAISIVSEPSKEKSAFTSFGIDPGQANSGVPIKTASTYLNKIYFPKEFNQEQVSIIERLELSEGVVVQGPPGTGKTHTIANIICHYLATGRKVLVSAKSESALSVLRDHIPEGIRDFCISLLSSEREGLKQLEGAVQILANQVTQANPSQLNKNIDSGMKRVAELENKINAIDNELLGWAHKHLQLVSGYGEDNILPMDLARLLIEDKERHVWLPDSINYSEKYSPKFTDKDISELREARKILGKYISYLGKRLPTFDEILDTQKISEIHHDLTQAQKIQTQALSQDMPIIKLSAEGAREKAESALIALKSVLEVHKVCKDFKWLAQVYKLWRAKERGCEEVLLLEALIESLEKLAEDRIEFIKNPVEFPEDYLTNHSLRFAITNLSEGKKAFGILSFGKSDVKKILQKIAVQGQASQEEKDWKIVLSYLSWRDSCISFSARWNAAAPEYGLPEIGEDIIDIGRWAKEISGNIELIRKVVDKFIPLLARDLPQLFHFGLIPEKILSSYRECDRAIKIIETNLSRVGLLAASTTKEQLQGRLAKCSGKISEDMLNFIKCKLGSTEVSIQSIENEWLDLCNELKVVINFKGYIDTVGRVSELIERSGAPLWAKKVRQEPAEAEDPWTPSWWKDSWEWSQHQFYINEIDGKERIRNLAKMRQEHDHDLKRTFSELVKNKTFVELKKNMSPAVQSALSMFTTALKRIGRGTGIRARRYRQDARSAMENCYSSIPCWIMSNWRVSESLPPTLGSFDLVIIDEASQSDIMALPTLLRGKKLLIVGDDKQVSPTAAFIEEKKILHLRNNYLQGQPFQSLFLPGESLYDLANAVFASNRLMLREHFRCVEPIIRFSCQFYTEELVPLRIPKASERLDPPLVDVLVPHGRRDMRTKINKAEAEAIIDEIKKITQDADYQNRSIGIISLIGAQQAQYINARILEELGEDVFMKHNIACGDSATFQGKERDIMFISMVECPKHNTSKTSLPFQQRFNVALSRARDRMYLFRSLRESDLKPDDLKAKIVRHFKNPMAKVLPLPGKEIELCESAFEREVFSRLIKLEYQVVPQVQAGPYRIDMVVEGPNDNRLAIELDGDKYHAAEKWIDDYNRQVVLERMGWRFWRCWGSSFIMDPEGCMNDLMTILSSMGITPQQGEHKSYLYSEHRIAEESVTNAYDKPDDEEVPCRVKTIPTNESDRLPTTLFQKKRGEKVPIKQYLFSGKEDKKEIANIDEYIVEVGDKVTFAYSDEPTRQVTWVIGDKKHDPDMGIVNKITPIAKALLGNYVDEEVELPLSPQSRFITILGVQKQRQTSMN